ncbi:twin-arginine translocase subunit TatC [Desulfosporosinus burensis]
MDKQMTVTDHLGELRYRLIISSVALLAGATVIYLNMDKVIMWLTAPLSGKQLYFIGPADGFFTTIQIAVVGGIMVSLPVLIYQAIAFIMPGCTRQERKTIFFAIPPALILFALGAGFGNQVIFPLVLRFFMGVGEGYLNPMLLGVKYFSFLLLLTFAMGMLFEIPLVMMALSRLGLVKSRKLRNTRMYGYIGILLLIGLIVPTPDVLTLVAICAPVLLLYELSIWIIFFMEKNKMKKDNVNYA